MGTFTSAKELYSVKHGDYGIKYQFVHNRDGKLVLLSPAVPAATSDIDLYGSEYPNLRDLYHEQPNHSVLADKGYQGASRYGTTVLTPTKSAPANSVPRVVDVQLDQSITKHRVICENYYGRLKKKYRILQSHYRGDIDSHFLHLRNCINLVNFSINYEPLRQDEGTRLLQIYNRQRKSGLAKRERINTRRKQAYQRKKRRLEEDAANALIQFNIGDNNNRHMENNHD